MSSTSSSTSSPRSESPVAAAMQPGPSDEQKVKSMEDPTPQAAGSSKTADGTDAESGIDKLLQRHRNELMYELRRLQHGDRPVTGQDNKRQVEDFFNRAQQESSGEAPPQDTMRNRPEAVLVEVNSLVERRPVSSVLQSAGFRSSLENALRSAIGHLSARAPSPNQQQQQRPRQQQRTSPLAGAGALAGASSSLVGNNRSSAGAAAAPTPPPAPSMAHHDSARRPVPRPRYSRHSPSPQPQERQPQEPQGVPPPPPLPMQPVEAPQPQQDRAQAWLQQQPLQQFAGETQQQGTVWDNLGQSHHDDFVFEISDLVQQQLVSSSLESAFRNRLEGLMRDRVLQTGRDGQRVQSFIQSLPRNFPHQRNDFSDLGIAPPMGGAESLSDDVSVISATAAVTVHNAQNNAAMSREMNSLKAQIAELKNMMRMSFDVQLDTQRAIRQEVAAAVAGALQGASTTTAPRPAPPRTVSEGHCLICLEGTVDSVLYQCGHMCVCHGCGLQLKSRGAHCPMCRAPIRDIIRAYRSNQN